MSIEPRRLWQVIHNMRDLGGSVTAPNSSKATNNVNSNCEHTQSIKTIIGSGGSVHEEEEDSYNHLIEEQDIIAYDSDTSASVPAIMETAITRPMSRNGGGVLDLVVESNSNHGEQEHRYKNLQYFYRNHLPVPEHLGQDGQMVLVKLNPPDHVITVNGASDLTRLMRPNGSGSVAYDGGDSSSSSSSVSSMDGVGGIVTKSPFSSPTSLNVSAEAGPNLTTTTTAAAASNGAPTTATNDEELTPLTWLQDKNLIQGINLTTKSQQKTNGAAAAAAENGTMGTPSTNGGPAAAVLTNKHMAYNPLICDKKEGMLFTLADMPKTTSFRIAGVADSAIVTELTSKILSGPPQGAAATLPQSGLHLIPTTTHTVSQVNGKGMVTRHEGVVAHMTHHVHKKYRREEHVKITKQQQQQQSQLSPNGTPLILPMFTERGIASKKYSADEMHLYASLGGNKSGGGGGGGGGAGKQGGSNKPKHPVNVPYNPFIHTNNKPPLSFSSLIFMAIENATDKALPVKEIYAWIVKHFPYFKTAPTGWKNSVRHNLSLNKCFQKVEKAPNMGKGSLWKVEQQYRPILMQALTRSPYHQFMAALDNENHKTGGPAEKGLSSDSNNNNVLMCNSSPSSSSNLSSTSSSLSTSPTGIDPLAGHRTHRQERMKPMGNGRPFDPVLFPYLSKEISKLDNNNNNAIYSNNHYHLTGGDSESESGYYDNIVPSVYHNRFGNGGSAGEDSAHNYAPYPFNGHSEHGTDNNNMDDVNAATAMLALKHGPKILFEGGIRNGHPVITSSPSEDHTYSAGNESADGEKVNGEVEIGSENGVALKNGAAPWSSTVHEASDDQINGGEQSDVDLEEQRKKAEGVDALLNLAGFASNTTTQIVMMKRRASSDMTCFSNENSMDCNNSTSSTVIFSSPSPTKRSKTRYSQGGSGGAVGSTNMR